MGAVDSVIISKVPRTGSIIILGAINQKLQIFFERKSKNAKSENWVRLVNNTKYDCLI